MEEYNASPVYRNLDARMKILGFEALDLLIALIIAGVMNLLFGHGVLALPLGVGLPCLALAVLYVSKRGKPDKFLVHWLKYQVTPGFYSAGEPAHEDWPCGRDEPQRRSTLLI